MMGALLAACGMVHFTAYALFLGAAILRMFLPASLDESARRDVHRLFHTIGAGCLLALFLTGVANIYPLTGLERGLNRAYLIALCAKLGLVVISVVLFILDIALSKARPDDRAMFPVRALLAVFLLLTGFAAWYLVRQEP